MGSFQSHAPGLGSCGTCAGSSSCWRMLPQATTPWRAHSQPLCTLLLAAHAPRNACCALLHRQVDCYCVQGQL